MFCRRKKSHNHDKHVVAAVDSNNSNQQSCCCFFFSKQKVKGLASNENYRNELNVVYVQEIQLPTKTTNHVSHIKNRHTNVSRQRKMIMRRANACTSELEGVNSM